MTFMNAKLDFWCARPVHLIAMDPGEWKKLSGQHESSCNVFDVDYNLHTEESLR